MSHANSCTTMQHSNHRGHNNNTRAFADPITINTVLDYYCEGICKILHHLQGKNWPSVHLSHGSLVFGAELPLRKGGAAFFVWTTLWWSAPDAIRQGKWHKVLLTIYSELERQTKTTASIGSGGSFHARCPTPKTARWYAWLHLQTCSCGRTQVSATGSEHSVLSSQHSIHWSSNSLLHAK